MCFLGQQKLCAHRGAGLPPAHLSAARRSTKTAAHKGYKGCDYYYEYYYCYYYDDDDDDNDDGGHDDDGHGRDACS